MNNFWKQPAKGFDENSRGRTRDEIMAREAQLGLKLPNLYKELMLLQNGGYVKKKGYKSEKYDFSGGLLTNGSSIAPLNGLPHFYDTFEGVLREFLRPNEIKEWANSEHCHPERLIVISAMDGHSCLCFDYGWKSEFAFSEPEVCVFDLETASDFPEEVLREKSFEAFVNNLVYSGYECNSSYYSVKYDWEIDELAQYISKKWEVEIDERTDDGYGHFNFDKYYFGLFTDSAGLKYRFWLTPNQHRAGTFLLQERPDAIYILKIESFDNQENSVVDTANIRNLVFGLASSEVEFSEILIPEYGSA